MDQISPPFADTAAASSLAAAAVQKAGQLNVAVVGLGYVGLPLAVEFGKRFATVGFDISASRIEHYRNFHDPSGEVSGDDLRAATRLNTSTDPAALATADFVLVAVPTPIDASRQPDLRPLVDASRTIGGHMKPGAVVVYESTVYPGATEEICIPELERASGLKWKRDFFVGYSPERINPGDRQHVLANTVKVVSGDTRETCERVAALYGTVVRAGVYRASSIRVAEACKVIENTQRDLNIALMNELAIIFDRIGIDTQEVLEAAGTKWNFLNFRPGLVGGHCIGVDPYYLTHKAEMVGYHPEVVLAGRRINDSMGKVIAENTIKLMIRAGRYIKGSRVNVLGLTFKENCPDLRNTRVMDVIRELTLYGVEVHVHDPVADPREARHEYGIELQRWGELPRADALVMAVAHREFSARPIDDYRRMLVRNGAIVDVKSILDRAALESHGLHVWRL